LKFPRLNLMAIGRQKQSIPLKVDFTLVYGFYKLNQ
jgi:hypothetical protein